MMFREVDEDGKHPIQVDGACISGMVYTIEEY